MRMLFLLISTIKCLNYNFVASKNYLLIEIFSVEWTNMTIQISENSIIQSSASSQQSQYLNLYYETETTQQYYLDLYLFPDQNYTINEVQQKDCPNNCSESGLCLNLECSCYEMMAGDRCQYKIGEIQNTQSFQFQMEPNQIQILAIYLQQSDLVDDQQQVRNIKLTTNQAINAKIYFLEPFEQPYKSMIDSKLVYNGILSTNGTTVDYSSKFQSYYIKTIDYLLILRVSNPSSISESVILQYELLNNDNSFQDFILVAILSVVSFIILLVIVYIIRRRCQYMTESKESKNNSILEPQNALLILMAVVEPAKDQECIICLEKLDVRVCRMTPCKHVLHEECLQQWLQKQPNCPLCRDPFLDEEGFVKIKTRNQTASFLNNNNQNSLVQSDRHSVRQMILMRSQQSRLAVFQ